MPQTTKEFKELIEEMEKLSNNYPYLKPESIIELLKIVEMRKIRSELYEVRSELDFIGTQSCYQNSR